MDRFLELRRVAVDAVPPHVFASRDKLQILQPDVLFVPVLEAQAMARRDGPVRLLPEQNVNANPIARRVAGCSHLLLQVAIHRARGADGYVFPSGRALALFELCFRGPSARLPTFHPFVGGDVPGLEAVRCSHVVAAAQAVGRRTRQVGRALFQPQVPGAAINAEQGTPQNLRDLFG